MPESLLELEGNNDGVEILNYAMTNDPAKTGCGKSLGG